MKYEGGIRWRYRDHILMIWQAVGKDEFRSRDLPAKVPFSHLSHMRQLKLLSGERCTTSPNLQTIRWRLTPKGIYVAERHAIDITETVRCPDGEGVSA
jgi:hypothetical protein